MQRDSQREKVYAAERIAKTLFPKDSFSTKDEVIAYVHTIIDTRWWKARFPDEIDIRPNLGSTSATGGVVFGRGKLWLPKWSWEPWVIMHELAHILCHGDRIFRGFNRHGMEGAHGRNFCHWYLELIWYFMGQPEYRCLRSSFREKRAKYVRARLVE